MLCSTQHWTSRRGPARAGERGEDRRLHRQTPSDPFPTPRVSEGSKCYIHGVIKYNTYLYYGYQRNYN